jgi:hypothetical protein
VLLPTFHSFHMGDWELQHEKGRFSIITPVNFVHEDSCRIVTPGNIHLVVLPRYCTPFPCIFFEICHESVDCGSHPLCPHETAPKLRMRGGTRLGKSPTEKAWLKKNNCSTSLPDLNSAEE